MSKTATELTVQRLKNRDDGTFSTILQTSVRKLPKKE